MSGDGSKWFIQHQRLVDDYPLVNIHRLLWYRWPIEIDCLPINFAWWFSSSLCWKNGPFIGGTLPIEVDGLPINKKQNMVIFHSYVNVYQRVNHHFCWLIAWWLFPVRKLSSITNVFMDDNHPIMLDGSRHQTNPAWSTLT